MNRMVFKLEMKVRINAYDWSANKNRFFSVGYVPIEELRKQMNTGSRKFGPLCIEGEV